MRKKVVAIMCVGALALTLAACGSSDTSEASSDTETETAEETAEDEEEAEEEVADLVEAAEDIGEEEAAEAEDTSADASATGMVDPSEEVAAIIDTSVNYLEGLDVDVLVKSRTHMFWVEAANSAEAMGDLYGCNVEILAPETASSNEEQIELLENSLVNPPDIYIIVPADSNGIAPAIQEINEAGIPIVNLNTKILADDCDYESFISVNQTDFGYNTVTNAIERIGDTGNAIHIMGTAGAQTYAERCEGADSAFADNPGWTVLESQYADANRDTAYTVMNTLITKYADEGIDLVYAEDGEMTLGCAQAIDDAGMTGEIKLAGENFNSEISEGVENGSIFLTMDDSAWLQTEVAFAVANAVMGGVDVEDVYYSPLFPVDSSNIDEYTAMYNERCGIE